MSTDRIIAINYELTQIGITFRETLAKALPLIEELQDLGVSLPPETRNLFAHLSKVNN
jgi:hypothetical protein